MPDFGEKSIQLIDEISGTYSHPNVTTEQDVLEFLSLLNDIEVSLDMNALTQNTTVRVYEKVDGTTYRLASEKIFPTDFPSNIKDVIVNLNGKNIDMKITFQSAVLEGASRNIPHARIEEVREL